VSEKVLLTRLLVIMLCCLVAAAAFPGGVSADRGAMSFFPRVDIYEPAQKAIIAWNGEEELLLLSTDLRASKPTKVLEVLPLPASPVIKRGDVKVFGRMNDLIRRNLYDFYPSKGPGGRSVEAAAEITFHEKIGAHDITVVHVLDSGYFQEWVGEYLGKQGVAGYKVPPVMLATIQQYILDGYEWFAFDVVELGTALQSNDVIEYRFASDKVYYPLRISGNARGETDIRLTIVSKGGVEKFMGIPRARFRPLHAAVDAAVAELGEVHGDMAGMFPAGNVVIQTLRLKGDLAEFDLDVLAR
jgi:hypothetical protein